MGKDRFRPGGAKDKGPKFVKLDHWLLRTAAWRDLDPVARALYIELRQRFNGMNMARSGSEPERPARLCTWVAAQFNAPSRTCSTTGSSRWRAPAVSTRSG